MALHIELSLDVQAYGDTVKSNRSFGFNFDDKVINDLEQESSARIKLAASASDVAVNFQGVTSGKLVVLKSEKAFGIKINGVANPVIELAPKTNTQNSTVTPAFLAMLADAVTELHLSNPDTSEETEIDVAVAGV